MKNITVSVICANYNQGDWIIDALESFLNQKTNFDFEILVIDDCSTDKSRQIIKDYASKYPNKIKAYYNAKNLGITRTWIKVCKNAKGRYIARCDGDDFWIDDKKLQKQVEVLEKNIDSLWCSTDYDIYSPEGKLISKSSFENGIVDKPKTYAEMFAHKGFTMSSTWLVDTKLMNNINSKLNENAVDDTFNIQLDLFNLTKLTYIPEPMVAYRINEGSDSRPLEPNLIKLRAKRLLDTQFEYLEKYKNYKYKEIIQELLKRNYLNEDLLLERLQHIHILESDLQKTNEAINSIINSKTYKLSNNIKSLYILPKRIINKLKRTKDKLVWNKIYINSLPTKPILKEQSIILNKLNFKPLISVLVPTYNSNLVYLKNTVDSVLGQSYSNWELIIVDDASNDDELKNYIKNLPKIDNRIKYKLLKTNKNISGATNEAIKLAGGEYISLLDHDDILHPSALFEIVKKLNTNKKYKFIYTDEDKINEKGIHLDPFIKPDWNKELLLCVNYITHFTTIKKEIVDKVGGERGEYNGAQDWDLFLRTTDKINKDEIAHIPKVLYSWRIHENSTADRLDAKPYVYDAQKKLLEDYFTQKGLLRDEFAVSKNVYLDGSWIVNYKGQDRGALHLPKTPIDIDWLQIVVKDQYNTLNKLSNISLSKRIYYLCQYSIDKKNTIR